MRERNRFCLNWSRNHLRYDLSGEKVGAFHTQGVVNGGVLVTYILIRLQCTEAVLLEYNTNQLRLFSIKVYKKVY